MIFIQIIIGIILYLICGFGTYILVVWYEKKYDHVETIREYTPDDIALWFIWPFMLLTIIWLVFANFMCNLMTKITVNMYEKMNERSNKNGKSSEN